METAAFLLSDGIITLAFTVIAVRMLRRSVRTHAAPEMLLGASFLLWGASYPLYDVPYVLGVDVHVMAPFANASRISWQTGTAVMALFVKRTFRSGDARATWFVVAIAALLLGGGMGSVWVGDYGGDYPLSNPWWWMEWTGSIAPVVWISTEASLNHARIRQRRWLGEGDALLPNRIALWCIVGLCWTVVEIVSATQYVLFELTGRWLASLSLVLALLELAGVAMVWLVFYPPAAYRSWVNRAEIPRPRAA